MIKILLISHSYPPLLTSNSIQVGRWTGEISTSGDIAFNVISVSPQCTSEKTGIKEQLLHPELLVHRTLSLEKFFLETKINGVLKKIWPALLAKPDFQSLWIPFAEAEINRLIDREFFDLVISCSHYITNHVIALKVWKKTGLPWIACFSDPWTDSIYFQEIDKKHGTWCRSLEREIVAQASAITVPCREMASLFLKRYGEMLQSKLHHIPHCYDRTLIEEIEQQHCKAERVESGDIRVVHTGSFYGKRTPLPFLDVLAILRKNGSAGQIRCLFVGADREDYRKALIERELLGCVDFIDRVSYEESIAFMKSAQLLLLIDAPCRGGESVFFPSKLADYLGTGLPIAGLTPAGSCSERILSSTGHHAIDINNMEEAVKTFESIFANVAAMPDHPPPEEYSHKYVTSRWRELIMQIVNTL
ncbi:MAG: glycosyltransferase [Vulcanimicrobiota bacterium]